MKRRVVAMLLSLTLCVGGTVEAGAAAFNDSAAGIEAVADADAFGDTAQDGQQETDSAEAEPDIPEVTPNETETPEEPEIPDTTVTPEVTETPEEPETPDATVTPEVTETPEEPETPDVTVTPEITEVPEITEAPEVTEVPEITEVPKDSFTAGEPEELTAPEAAKTVERAIDDNTAVSAESGAAMDKNGVVIAKTTDWKKVNGKYKLKKAVSKVSSAKSAETANVENEDIQLTSVGEPEELALADTESRTDDSNIPSEAAATSSSYYTAKDGLIKVNTNGHTGYYLFDASGYMVTGRITRKPGTTGYTGKTTVEWYMTEASTAVLYAEAQNQAVTPWTSNLGQQKRGYWLWTGTNFRYYGMKGYYISIPDLENLGKRIIGQNKKIDGAWYNLDKDGVPYVGIKTVKTGSSSYQYYYQPAANENDIPGKMFYGGWTSVKGNKGTRWIYCNPKASKRGQMLKHGVYISRIKSKKYSFLIDANGYILKNTMAKTENGNYYATDKKGHVRKNQMVKNSKTGARYYFGSNGRRAPWTNGWHRCKGASNRLYYFGSTAGKVEERYGWQKIYSTSGVYCGWYYFNKNGNHYMNTWINNKYYFDAKGKSASGITTINGKKYFFATSSESKRRGWIYKNTLIRYKNNWYFASQNGVLRQKGWQKVEGYWYYLNNYVVQTNRTATRNGATGYLDSQGRFITKSEWVIVNDYNNQVKYLYQGKYLVNTSKWIDGKLYYFDKDGFRRNDISAIYGGPYYVEVDRVNGVMTVYTDSSKQIPVKTIRVSVGLPGTPTWTGTYKLSRSSRWQSLMGPSWGQYGTHVDGCGEGGIFVHSIACAQPNSYNLSTAEYLKLGNPASHGCIRTCVADAKWVYYNCNGATIRIFDGNYDSRETFKGPLGRKPITPLVGIGNYDPTDPEV